MIIIDKTTGHQMEGVIEPLNKIDWKIIKKEKRFGFNWDELTTYELYKLRLKNSEHILGLMALQSYPQQGFGFLEIVALEASKENVGASKKYEPIAGCLIAFACREAFKRGLDGCVALIPKTVLYEYYQQEYGFLPAGKRVFTDNENSWKLIAKYLNERSW